MHDITKTPVVSRRGIIALAGLGLLSGVLAPVLGALPALAAEPGQTVDLTVGVAHWKLYYKGHEGDASKNFSWDGHARRSPADGRLVNCIESGVELGTETRATAYQIVGSVTSSKVADDPACDKYCITKWGERHVEDIALISKWVELYRNNGDYYGSEVAFAENSQLIWRYLAHGSAEDVVKGSRGHGYDLDAFARSHPSLGTDADADIHLSNLDNDYYDYYNEARFRADSRECAAWVRSQHGLWETRGVRVSVADDRQQLIMVWAEEARGYAQVTKGRSGAAELAAAAQGNPCYDLAGAVYTLYTDQACTAMAKTMDGAEARVTVKADGTADAIAMRKGTYWAKETTAPARGYKMDPDAHQVDVRPNETANIGVADPPMSDTLPRLGKLDREVRDAQGKGELTGARFRVRYYKGLYTDEAAIEAAGAVPDCEAVWATSDDGTVDLAGTKPVKGTWGYVDGERNYAPLGTVTVTEVAAPSGYLLNGSTYVYTAEDDGSHATVRRTYYVDGRAVDAGTAWESVA